MMIDLHSHVLPRMDDGAKDSSESIAMLQDAYSQGVRICAATPHCTIHRENKIPDFLARRRARYERLQEAIADLDEPLPHIILGAEVYLDHDISAHEDIKKLCYENTDHMLVELSSDLSVSQCVDCIYSLSMLGIKPLIAHVHRYPKFLDLIRELKGLDVTYQINCSHFLSFKGRKEILKMLETYETFIASSDMHNMTTRPCDVEKAMKKSAKAFPRTTPKMFGENALELLKLKARQ